MLKEFPGLGKRVYYAISCFQINGRAETVVFRARVGTGKRKRYLTCTHVHSLDTLIDIYYIFVPLMWKPPFPRKTRP